MTTHKRCILIILDGWGVRENREGNAVEQAETPFLDMIREKYPSTELLSYGESVGLPEGVMGNSEVGHLNIGAGRVVFQDLLRIDNAIKDGSFFENKSLKSIFNKILSKQSSLHLMGLVSDGGVHSQLKHLFALLDMARDMKLHRVFVHAILDGRDTPPHSGVTYLKSLQAYMEKIGIGTIASICGRYYAMDRDKRWDRIQKAYHLYTQGQGITESDPITAIEKSYERDETDEFVKPTAIVGRGAATKGLVKNGDGIIFFNFRADRAREITQAFTGNDFTAFDRHVLPALCEFVCMTLYDDASTLPVAFEPVRMQNILGEVISKNGLRQLRIAETEKYAHVTYFFNGGEETPFKGEDRCLISSPRDVATYDQKPEMSAPEVTKEVIHRIESDDYDFIVLNFANMDMVGHTGVMEAAIKACEVVDACVAKIIAKTRGKNCAAIVTADHGNAEKMMDDKGNPHTAHTTGLVRFVLVDDTQRGISLQKGALCDIAPSILQILGLSQPPEMTGRSLILQID